MRVKLSKLLSAVLAICIVFVGFTAFAADATVVTTTNYTYAKHNNGVDEIPTGDKAATMKIITDVTNVTVGTEVTYLVRKADGTIVYINQDTATNGSAHFEFTADQGDIFAATAKYGSNGGYTMPTFTFNHGVKYLTSGNVDVQLLGAPVLLADTGVGTTEDAAYVFMGTVSGPVTKYGVAIGGEEFLAMDCDANGEFVIVIQGITAAEAAKATVVDGVEVE